MSPFPPECARGNTFRIEYEVWAAPPSVLEGLAKAPHSLAIIITGITLQT